MKKTKTPRLDVDIAMRIASEHLAYRSAIEEIEDDLERVRAKSGSTETLLELLRSFQAQVRRHFALEERAGLYKVYREREPELQGEGAHLLGQHRDLLARLRDAIDAVAQLARPGGPGLERSANDLERLFAALREHERAEDALLDRLVEQDIRRAD